MSSPWGRLSRRQMLRGVAATAAAAIPMAGYAIARGARSAAELTIAAGEPGATISRHIYGHFAEHLGRCIYEGVWVGEDSTIPNTRGIRNDVVAALRRMKIPNLRWPGGCFADTYHWRDGIGPRAGRPSMVNTHWGGVVENNHFGSHEFMDLCEQLGTDAYVCGNVGSGSVSEMREWVEYLTADAGPQAEQRRKNGREQPWKVPYWGVGNENWGCGGNMRPEYYADLYKQYATYVRDSAGNRISRIACGPNRDRYDWTEVLMSQAGRNMQGLSLHYYTSQRREGGSATEFGLPEWYGVLKKTLVMEELITKHSAIMDRFDAAKRVSLVVDEWGSWYDVEPGTNPGFLYQQNSLRDALIAGINLNIFNSHCDRVRMANIAQTINVLQAMILTDGPRMVLTPTYHVFEMYSVHQDAKLLPMELKAGSCSLGAVELPAVHASASLGKDKTVQVTLCNLDPEKPVELECKIEGANCESVAGRVLTAPEVRSHNTFDAADQVMPAPLADVAPAAGGFRVTLPARSVSVIIAKG